MKKEASAEEDREVGDMMTVGVATIEAMTKAMIEGMMGEVAVMAVVVHGMIHEIDMMIEEEATAVVMTVDGIMVVHVMIEGMIDVIEVEKQVAACRSYHDVAVFIRPRL